MTSPKGLGMGSREDPDGIGSEGSGDLNEPAIGLASIFGNTVIMA